MGHLPRHISPLPRVRARRLHTREEEDAKGPPTAGISQGTPSSPLPNPLPPIYYSAAPTKPIINNDDDDFDNITNQTLCGNKQWLVPRHELARVDPRYALPPQPHPMYAAGAANNNNNSNYHYRPGYQNQYDPSYNMQSSMPPPPPMYDPNAPRPPMYEAPQGGTKMAPSQEYEAPPGPPPPPPTAAAAATGEATAQPVRRDDTGSSNPFRA